MIEEASQPRGRGGPGGLRRPVAGRMMPGEKAQDFKGTMKKLIAYLGRYKKAIIIVFIFASGFHSRQYCWTENSREGDHNTVRRRDGQTDRHRQYRL